MNARGLYRQFRKFLVKARRTKCGQLNLDLNLIRIANTLKDTAFELLTGIFVHEGRISD